MPGRGAVAFETARRDAVEEKQRRKKGNSRPELPFPRILMPKVWPCVQIKDRLAQSPKGVSSDPRNLSCQLVYLEMI